MRWWEQQIGGATRGRVIALLRRGVSTVEEIAADLRVTDNAVRAQIQTLEKAGLVRAAGTRHGVGAGKPATLYQIAPSAEAELSGAYPPVLTALLESLAERLPADTLEEVFRDAGRRLAPARTESRAGLEARVRTAAALLTTLGAELDVERIPHGFQIRGYACPLASAVRVQSGSCHIVEELISVMVGAPVRECCDRSENVRCRFEVLARSA